jgi:hypothetical protein
MKKHIFRPPTFVLTPEYKETVRSRSYLGKKGYTIPKTTLNTEDYDMVKKDLWMMPFTIGGPKNGGSLGFPIYRENPAKIYVPRFYGISRYGLPDTCELEAGDNIAVPFVKELRDYQNKIVKVYTDYVDTYLCDNVKGGGGILEVPCGKGKCLAKGTLVLLYNGSKRKVEDIVVGDVLMGDDQTPRRVLSLAHGWETMYRIEERGTQRSYTVNESHILSLRHYETGETLDICIGDYIKSFRIEDAQSNLISSPSPFESILNENWCKKDEWRGYRIPNNQFPTMYRIDVKKMNVGEYYGFEIDGNRRFVLGDYTVTHNTVMALNIISKVQKKTIIFVHKEFLMNQWIERIAEFMPDARVGKIQGPVFDIENKDIVIGMIQTMHSRDFPADAFSSFGMTIIDEVHRIGSEEFSKTLFKIVTPYMLGISATVERKDRLTKLLYMFIGNKIYSEERTDDDIVNVRSIQFKSNDSEFNETEYDFRGAPKYSTMITKLCQFGPRSDFIVRVISDLIQEYPQKQIMILAHNRELLTYLYDAIHHKISQDANTVGYYVGGMKEKNLKETEKKRIVLATYAMAAEALDIKTLSTLVMATPKTDIEQSVGRILRARGQNPIVVDIVDSHEYLKRQWNTRRLFYKKCMYKIWSTNSAEYRGFQQDTVWKLEYDPATASSKEPKKCMITVPKELLEKEDD